MRETPIKEDAFAMRHVLLLLLTLLGPPGAARSGVPVVVADIAPVHSLAAAVMGDLGAPVLLADRGASAHDFQLRPSQAAALAGADLVIWIGPELTPGLAAALEARAAAADRLRLLAVSGTHLQPFAPPDGAMDGAMEDAMEDGGHDHGHGTGIDPHAWLDAGNAMLWADAIAARLSALDPANGATYRANAAALRQQIAAADAAAATLLAPVKDRPFAAFHDAYGYFTARYGLHPVAALAAGDAAPPGARRLAGLRAAMAGGAIVCLFPEAGHDPAALTALAGGTPARLGAPLDPEGSTLEPGPALYPALITGLAGTIAACLGG